MGTSVIDRAVYCTSVIDRAVHDGPRKEKPVQPCPLATNNDIRKMDIRCRFAGACARGTLDEAAVIFAEFWDKIPYRTRNQALGLACGFGHMDVVKWLIKTCHADRHYYDEMPLHRACAHGHLALAQWLVSFGDVEMHVCHDMAFRYACANGNQDVAKWLVGLGGVDVHADNDNAFTSACANGFLSTAKWLLTLDGVHCHVRERAFIIACLSGSMEVCRWLMDQDPEYEWPAPYMEKLQTWSVMRDAWIRTVVWAGARKPVRVMIPTTHLT